MSEHRGRVVTSDGVSARPACDVCGEQPAPIVHVVCHPHDTKYHGCGHLIADHSEGMRCRVCREECGIDCRTRAQVFGRVERQGRLL